MFLYFKSIVLFSTFLLLLRIDVVVVVVVVAVAAAVAAFIDKNEPNFIIVVF